jgi:uncharacterized phage protein gp47/JayE
MRTIPTINQLFISVKSDLETSFGSNIPVFGKIFLVAMALVQAGKLKLFYLALGMVQKNIFVDTADPESMGGTLERFGRIKLKRNPFPAVAGQYTVQVTGLIGATIPASTTFKSNDDSLSPGKLFILDLEHVMVGTTDTIILRALEAGQDSKLQVNDLLTATAPIASVDRSVMVTIETVVPLAAEDLEDYRKKAEDAYTLEPQGGAPADYRLWSYDAQGVEQVYPYKKPAVSNEVVIYIEATVADSTDGKGTPLPSLIADVEAVVNFDPDTSKPLNERGRRPTQVIVEYLPITVMNIDVRIYNFQGLTPALETSIFNAMKARIDVIRPFVAAADILANKDDILSINTIISEILNVKPGAVFTSVELDVNSVTENTHTFIAGDIPYLNSITYL